MKRIALIVAIALSTSLVGNLSVQASEVNLDQKDTVITEKKDDTDEGAAKEKDSKSLENNQDDISKEEIDINKDKNLYDKFETESSSNGIMLFAVQNVSNENIISDTKVTQKIAEEWAKSKGATDEFIGLASLYWKYAKDHGGVNPAVAYAQSAKETGYGNFGGVIDATYHNPCGLKTRQGGDDNDPNAHFRFENWNQGVQAHLDHLALYAGANGYPRKDTYDPRHFEGICGKAKTVEELGGAWAPSASYGLEVLNLYDEMLVKASEIKDGWVQENNNWYYYENEQKVTGLKDIDGYTYYFDKDGVRQSGFIDINKNRYYFDENGKMHKGWKDIGDKSYYLDVNTGEMATGLRVLGGKTFYFNNDGVMSKGFTEIEGKTYYFNDLGRMHKGWLDIGDKSYYLDINTGEMATGLRVLGGKTFYFNNDGVMSKGFTEIEGKTYYFNDLGRMHKGWLDIEDKSYYLDVNTGEMATGFKVLGGKTFYFTNDGVMSKGIVEIEEEVYYFNDLGRMETGWIDLDNNKYYFDENGKAHKGFLELEGKKYYFNEKGIMQTGIVIVDGKTYYFNSAGEAITKGWFENDGKKYYLNEDGTLKVGLNNIDGDLYYFDTDGEMLSGWIDVDSKRYYFNENGKMHKGWKDIGDKSYYLDVNTGEMATGFKVLGGKTFYFTNDGVMSKGFVDIEGSTYYFNDLGRMEIGWLTLGVEKYYFNEDGKMQKGWSTIGNDKYYFNEDGRMHRGWKDIGSKSYYLDINTGIMATGFRELGGQTFYFTNEGIMSKGWTEVKGDKYYFNDFGRMQKGWQRIEGKEYYFYPESGIMAKSTIIDGREIDENGVAKDLTKKLIVVDPGHNYGGDYGAESTIDGVTYKETELDMFIAVKLKNELEKQGYNVVLTRQIFERPMDDLNTSIAKRVDLANNLNAAAFISIHHDSSTSIMAKGTTSFYSSWKSGLDNTDIVPGKDPNGYDWYDLSVDLTPTKEALVGKDLAKTIVDNLSSDVNYSNRKEHDRNLGVVKRTNMPSVLVECGFITNPEEAKKAADPNNQQKIAESIAKSVKQVIG
ncbi:N-acetylmuramoyl-L-alanine amidase [Clostridium perfringens]|uniref:N-acetylmuramoyl-L-alanine amidase n=2 Tax=Clostridium perfringens TaxID=1502 RepID=UPI0010F0CAE0|nr:N-acetylmuramoyl-L-alanine amidase [Clostridium perfringens]VTQ55862.1 cell wall hydrolase/autolysin [Clostridium perfringens]HBZ6545753.1 N-acetylmuramoyl-L-alanine amidase [Clostridium perfringens]